jgi:hypothetical protein
MLDPESRFVDMQGLRHSPPSWKVAAGSVYRIRLQ